MTGRIAEDAIRVVRDRANLAEVVSDVVALKRRGRSAVGLCPFHTEKTPSFTVSEERGFFHCFGCGGHGDVFTFVMKTQSVTFPEAVEAVAARFGIPLPREGVAGPRSPTAPLVAAHEVAAAFYRATLRGPQGARARAYLAERGVGDAVIERFALGYAPATGDALAKHLAAHGVRDDDALTAGLVAQRASGGLYDRFRDRVMFPISDASGRVCAFGGRVLPGPVRPGADAPPKYLNSPESPIFQKGRMLYGLALAREAIRDRGRVVVVEGNLDVVSLAQAGVEEVVAPLGTALTADQLRVLRRVTERVIACFDGDAAGRRAAARSFPTFIEAGLWGQGVFLPTGDDPDTFVRMHGGDAFRALLEQPVPLVDAFVRDLAGPDREAVGRHAQAAREVVRVLKRVSDPLEREPLIRLAAHYLGVREETLRAQGAAAATPAAPAPRPPVPEPKRGEARAELLIVELLAVDPSVAPRIAAEDIVREFENDECRAAAEQLLGAADEDTRRQVVEELSPALRDRIVQRVLHDDSDEDRAQMVSDCIDRIRRARIRRQRRELRVDLQAAEVRGDETAATALNDELNRYLTEKDPPR
jgi:DNA primase